MRPALSLFLIAMTCAAASRGAQDFDTVMKGAAVEYRQRAEQAAKDLNAVRAKVAAEKAPLLQQMRAAEDRIIAAESETTRMDTQREDSTDQRRKLLLTLDATRKTTSYASTLAHDSLKAAADGFAPGETQMFADRVQALEKELDDPVTGQNGRAALDIADFLIARTQSALGGYRANGSAMLAETNQVVDGTFAFVGPETFFRPAAGGSVGTVRPREGARHPVSYALPSWNAGEAAAFFSGQPGTILADASSGKALRLHETNGTFFQHVQKGGVVAFLILIVGLVSALMIVQKVRDLLEMTVDAPATVENFLGLVADGQTEEATRTVETLRRTTRELFAVGLCNADQPKNILEERLQAVLLKQRLHYERRLPLLAVIATAAPLMGLLGTVVGMVKTFALITVFGTGNAGKLSSGISEVLIATELGLAVAIPTLVAHGFLAQRIHKNLSLLERYALEFTTAVEIARVAGRTARPESAPV